MTDFIKNKKIIIPIIAAALIAVFVFGFVFTKQEEGLPAYSKYVEDIVRDHAENSKTTIAFKNDAYKKYEDEKDIDKILEKDNKALDAEITVLIDVPGKKYDDICEDIMMDLGMSHVKCDLVMYRVSDLDIDNLEDNKTKTTAVIN